ncbi:MAG: peptidoglycan-binding protein [Alphaproteobacteria bacterium]|nr:peptidoglycan-binding protein [Alphaproteobacteria bacterium]
MNRFAVTAIGLMLPAASAFAAAPAAIETCDERCATSRPAPVQVATISYLLMARGVDAAAPVSPPSSLIRVQATEELPPAPEEEAAAAEGAKPPPNWEPNGDIILSVQRTLTTLGYDPGPLDGAMGPSTTRAIRSYQDERDIEQTGEVTYELVQRLEAELEGQGGSEAVQETTESPPPGAIEEPEIVITDDPSTYDLGDLEDLNTFD